MDAENASEVIEVDPACKWPGLHPVWDEALPVWGSGWYVHLVIFVAAFGLLSIYAFTMLCLEMRRYCGSSHERRGGILKRRLSGLRIALHSLIFVACFTRTLSLGIDPYGSRGILICPSGVVLWSLGWPCLVSAFSILLLLLLETTRMSLAPSRIQKPSILGAIIATSLSYVLFTDFLVAYDNSTMHAITFCQVLFVLWGILVSFGYLFVWWKIRSNLAASKGVQTTSYQRDSADTPKLRRLNTIILVSAVIGTCLTIGNLYWLSVNLDNSFTAQALKPWSWFVFNTCQRILEVGIAIMILVTSFKSSKRNSVEDHGESMDSKLHSDVALKT